MRDRWRAGGAVMVIEVFGAACALIGGLGLFIAGEQDRRAQRGVVKVEACEGRQCARCTRPAKICRFDAVLQIWVYGAELECLEERCQATLLPLAIRAGDYVLEPMAEPSKCWRCGIDGKPGIYREECIRPRLVIPDLLADMHLRKMAR